MVMRITIHNFLIDVVYNTACMFDKSIKRVFKSHVQELISAVVDCSFSKREQQSFHSRRKCQNILKRSNIYGKLCFIISY